MRFTGLLSFIVGVSLAAAEVRMTPERRVAPGVSEQRGIQVVVNRSGHVLAGWRETASSIRVSFDGVILPGAQGDDDSIRGSNGR